MVLLVNIIIITLAVLIHYEALYRITIAMPGMKIKHRYRIVIGVFGSLIAHSVEILLFALAYYVLPRFENWGYLEGNYTGTFMDCVYFSYTTFTTLGTGDIVPHGQIRYLVGLESLTGLLLITWTASFLFFEMRRYWDNK